MLTKYIDSRSKTTLRACSSIPAKGSAAAIFKRTEEICKVIIMKRTQKLYACRKCGVKYGERKWAEKCYGWCKKHPSCNIMIIRHAAK